MRNIFLIGYRCSGKTSVGKKLANELGRAFIDTDDEIVYYTDTGIKDFVEQHGWKKFRQLESDMIKKVCKQDLNVIATGGGTVMDPENVNIMRNAGMIVWLKVKPETVLSRIRTDSRTEDFRPSLSGKGLTQEVFETMQEREPFYEKAMDACITADEIDIDSICMEIIRLLNNSSFSAC